MDEINKKEVKKEKPKFWKRKIGILGKQIPVVVLLLVAVGGLGSAALLTMYGTITGKAQVEQSVVISAGPGATCTGISCEYIMGDSPVYGGEIDVQTITVTNRGDKQAPIKFETTVYKCTNPDYTGCSVDNGVVTTRYYNELKLENKDTTTWVVKSDSTEATLKYDLISSTFNYRLEAKGLQATTEYALIYYADKQNRFVNWGGDNPGAVIVTFTTDGSGYKLISGSQNIDMNLPQLSDWNIDPSPDYCNNGWDHYNLCGGAKIWLVPKADYNDGTKKLAWNPANYLFETDMIDYTDSSISSALMLNHGKLNLSIENTFNPATEPGYYKVTTTIVPATP